MAKTPAIAGNQFVPCNPVPTRPTEYIGAEGHQIPVHSRVIFPTGPDGGKYITVPNKPWLTTDPRKGEFMFTAEPNPSHKPRSAKVLLQGNMNPSKQYVTIIQAGAPKAATGGATLLSTGKKSTRGAKRAKR